MEKVRFEAFNVEELRVLRRACYEAGAAFGDPGHAGRPGRRDPRRAEKEGGGRRPAATGRTAGKGREGARKGRADQPPVAQKAFQKPGPQKKRAVQRLDILERAKAAQPAESAHRAPEPPVEAKFTGFLYVRCEKCGQERGFCAKTPISSCYCRECGGKTELKNMRQVKIWCECGSAYRYHTNIQDAAFDMPCLNCEAPVALEWNENKNRYQPMNSEPSKARRGRK